MSFQISFFAQKGFLITCLAHCSRMIPTRSFLPHACVSVAKIFFFVYRNRPESEKVKLPHVKTSKEDTKQNNLFAKFITGNRDIDTRGNMILVIIECNI